MSYIPFAQLRENDGYFVREMDVAPWVLACNVTQRNIRIVEGK